MTDFISSFTLPQILRWERNHYLACRLMRTCIDYSHSINDGVFGRGVTVQSGTRLMYTQGRSRRTRPGVRPVIWHPASSRPAAKPLPNPGRWRHRVRMFLSVCVLVVGGDAITPHTSVRSRVLPLYKQHGKEPDQSNPPSEPRHDYILRLK